MDCRYESTLGVILRFKGKKIEYEEMKCEEIQRSV
jgi:hypothetical protein